MSLVSPTVREQGKTADDAIHLYTNQGFTLIARTEASMTLVRPSDFNVWFAAASVCAWGVGLLYYVAVFLLLRPDTRVVVTTDLHDYVTGVHHQRAALSTARWVGGSASLIAAILITLLLQGVI
jgi:hypothetical protein